MFAVGRFAISLLYFLDFHRSCVVVLLSGVATVDRLVDNDNLEFITASVWCLHFVNYESLAKVKCLGKIVELQACHRPH